MIMMLDAVYSEVYYDKEEVLVDMKIINSLEWRLLIHIYLRAVI